jgi:long-subunit acyl-CoA synthetase (AMP-forming)
MQDYQRELDKLEERMRRENDFRFNEVLDHINRLERNVQSITDKIDNAIAIKEQNRLYWVRYFIGFILSFALGSGALGFVQFIQGLLRK